MPENKNSRPKGESKMPWKKKLICEKKAVLSDARKKTDLATSDNTNRESYEKIALKRGETCLKPGDFTWSYLCRFTQEETLTQPRTFFAWTSFSL